MKEKYEICRDLFHGFDIDGYLGSSPKDRLALLPAAMQHILEQDDGKQRLVKAVAELSKAFALAVPRDEAITIRDEVAFFQVVKAALVKSTGGTGPSEEDNVGDRSQESYPSAWRSYRGFRLSWRADFQRCAENPDNSRGGQRHG